MQRFKLRRLYPKSLTGVSPKNSFKHFFSRLHDHMEDSNDEQDEVEQHMEDSSKEPDVVEEHREESNEVEQHREDSEKEQNYEDEDQTQSVNN